MSVVSDRLSLERLVKVFDIFEYVSMELANAPRILVRSFPTFEEAMCYVSHPANSHRILTIAPTHDRLQA